MSKVRKIIYISFLVLSTSTFSFANSELDDPYENSNRAIHNFNDKVDTFILRPVSIGYSFLPNPIEEGIANALENVGEPINFTNYIFQGNLKFAFKSLARFLINSTVGLAGLIDVADKMKLKKDDTDFGLTLKAWEANEGAYLVIPFFGPRSSRHLAGSIVDIIVNPLNYILKDEDSLVRLSPTLLYSVSARSGNMETIDNLKETSIDYYSSLKSIYHQNRLSNDKENLKEIDLVDDFFQYLEEENINE